MIHLYTGDGKGKTTAALGLALRSVGAGKKVAIVQFMKKGDSSEFKAIKKYKLPIDVFGFGIGFYKILGDKLPAKKHRQQAEKALGKAREIIRAKKYELVILDEINVALAFKLIKLSDILALLNNKELNKIEVVLTGRKAPQKLKNVADLITVMRNEKHYFNQGIAARQGIEY